MAMLQLGEAEAARQPGSRLSSVTAIPETPRPGDLSEGASAPPSDSHGLRPAGLLQFRTIFLSDLHLGSQSCDPDRIHDFLTRTEAETIYLIGDIIDFWLLKRRFFWPQSHTEVLRLLLEKAANGTRLVYLPGNHDSNLRALDGITLGNLRFCNRWIHTAADGRRYLVIHGDQFDRAGGWHPRLALLGARVYNSLVVLSRVVHRGRPQPPAVSVARFFKWLAKRVCIVLGDFRGALAGELGRHAVDGVVYGHLHEPFGLTLAPGLREYNCGDWIESCSAVVETIAGELRVVHWLAGPEGQS